MTETGFRTETEFTLFDAPDISTLLKHTPSARAKAYEEKINAALKAVTLTLFRNDDIIDGATFIDKGPAFSRSLANLTDTSDATAKVIDFLTTPENPWWAFSFAAMSLGLQLLRNHEHEARQAATQAKMTWRQRRAMRKLARQNGEPIRPSRPGPAFTLKLPLGRKLTLHIPVPRASFIVGLFRSQTHDPVKRTEKILSDERVIKALAKENIHISITHAMPVQTEREFYAENYPEDYPHE